MLMWFQVTWVLETWSATFSEQELSLFFFCLPVWKVSERNGISELINKHLQSNVTVLLIYNILMDRSHLQLYLTVHSFLYYFSQNTIAKSKQLKNKNGTKIPNCVTYTVQRSDRLRTKHLEGDSRCVICKQTTGDVLPEITQEISAPWWLSSPLWFALAVVSSELLFSQHTLHCTSITHHAAYTSCGFH